LSGILLKSLILGVIGWLLVLMLIQSGLAQVKKAQEAANPITPQPIEP
jgi:hypothetical protein